MKNGCFSDFKIFAGNGNPELAQEISQIIGKPLGACKVGKFSDGEVSVSLGETVRGYDCFIIQSTGAPVNTNLMELCIMIDAMKRASAGRINAVIPYFGYARQDRISKAREPLTARLVADIISVAGADRVITMDLHAPQIQGYFNIPVDHMIGQPFLEKYFEDKHMDNVVIVSPDHGSVKRTRTFASLLNAPIAIIDKRRPKANVAEIMNIVGDVEGKNCILVDDMIDTAGTITGAADALKAMGAAHVYACATHGVFSGPAFEKIQKSAIEEMVVLNTNKVQDQKICDKIKTLSVAPVFAEIIQRVFSNTPLTPVFDVVEKIES
ncbi:MAG: ribose-phosphate pyrophosphokinase [Firmicutes bacterium]|nr:ribose-phosphate pyrophosphokinase [Bacillota bacterium]